MNKKLEFFSSMAVAFIVLILVFLCIRFSGQGKFATHGGTNPSDVKCIYTSVWPDNEYTRLICEPESGTIEYILDGSNAGYYAIFYNNISEEEIQKYIDQLKTLGYAEEASASESVSTGVLLRKDETWISIAYSEGGFGIRIQVMPSVVLPFSMLSWSESSTYSAVTPVGRVMLSASVSGPACSFWTTSVTV